MSFEITAELVRMAVAEAHPDHAWHLIARWGWSEDHVDTVDAHCECGDLIRVSGKELYAMHKRGLRTEPPTHSPEWWKEKQRAQAADEEMLLTPSTSPVYSVARRRSTREELQEVADAFDRQDEGAPTLDQWTDHSPGGYWDQQQRAARRSYEEMHRTPSVTPPPNSVDAAAVHSDGRVDIVHRRHKGWIQRASDRLEEAALQRCAQCQQMPPKEGSKFCSQACSREHSCEQNVREDMASALAPIRPPLRDGGPSAVAQVKGIKPKREQVVIYCQGDWLD